MSFEEKLEMNINGISYGLGIKKPLGASLLAENVVNFALYSEHAEYCEVMLYHGNEDKPFVGIPMTRNEDNIFSACVQIDEPKEIEYCYRCCGAYAPKQGLRFDNTAALLDPYAKMVSARPTWGGLLSNERYGRYRGKVYYDDFDWAGDELPKIDQKDLVIYETHVRSFTMGNGADVEHPGTYRGIIEKIPYLKELGINCIELLPVYEFDELERERYFKGKRLFNYWGYSTVNFFSPKQGYASCGAVHGEQNEFKEMVKALHQNNIKLILDVVYNHTCEGEDGWQPFGFRGIDDDVYYITMPDGNYGNFTGCGNTFKCNHPAVSQMILDSLKWWHKEYHVDGFRFDLAPILVRGTDSEPMWKNSVIQKIAEDPELQDAILIAEPWDAAGLYLTGQFQKWGRWSEWNDKYRNTVRQFINGDDNCFADFMDRIAGSPDLYRTSGAQSSINFINCHDGFTLYDLVSYNFKHNENNGEQNRDGSNWNASNNNGYEGATSDLHIQHMRLRKMKSLLAILMLSRGIPMFCGGDEIANTQFGNNNAYCQDNEISWIDWTRKNEFQELFDFVKRMIAFRQTHPTLRYTGFGLEAGEDAASRISFFFPNGVVVDPGRKTHCMGALYLENTNSQNREDDSFIYLAINVCKVDIPFFLPEYLKIQWEVFDDSSTRNRPGTLLEHEVVVEPYSVVILTGKRR